MLKSRALMWSASIYTVLVLEFLLEPKPRRRHAQ